MPLRCLDRAGRSIHSFDLADEEWRSLRLENRRARHLRMPCCSSPVTLKRSRLGTPFFAHKAVGTCATAAETEAHLRLKRMAVEAARANGWTADTEKTGASPFGEQWKADVLAQKGKSQVAVEIQWSSQTNEELLRRQKRYGGSGVRGLWLLRQPGFPITGELPAVCIGGSLEDDFLALIPSHEGMSARNRNQPELWHQILPMRALLDAAFSKRLRFGLPPNAHATVSVQVAFTTCWHRRCRARIRILTSIDVAVGPNEYGFSVPELGEYPELLRSVLDRLPPNLGLGEIKPRFSKTQSRFYMSNGCSRCDRIFGEHFEIHVRYDEKTLVTFPIRISERWQQAIGGHDAYEERWGVYPLAAHPI
jgi:Competence protein CoiA-like family